MQTHCAVLRQKTGLNHLYVAHIARIYSLIVISHCACKYIRITLTLVLFSIPSLQINTDYIDLAIAERRIF